MNSPPPKENGPAPLVQGHQAGHESSHLSSLVAGAVNLCSSGWEGVDEVPVVGFDFVSVDRALGECEESIEQDVEGLKLALRRLLGVVEVEAYRGGDRDPIGGLRAACAVLYLVDLPFTQGLGMRWFARVLGISHESFRRIVARMRDATGIEDARELSASARLKLQSAAYRRKKEKASA